MSDGLYKKIRFNYYDEIMNKHKISGVTNSRNGVINIFSQLYKQRQALTEILEHLH